VRRIVEHEISENNAKIVIMCRYRAQVEAYQRLFAEHGVCAAWGGMKQNSRGEKVVEGRVARYAVDSQGEYQLDSAGRPIEDEKGTPMLATDYELLTFQESKNRILVATYDVGSQGMNMPAAEVLIFDQVPRSYTQYAQTRDRIHRSEDDFFTLRVGTTRWFLGIFQTLK
jgi:superfamily II DNA or RNA helicase